MKLDPKKTIFLIDGSSFLYRAYYSMRPLHTPQGEPVQAVYGFCRMIKKLINTYAIEYIVLVWDSRGKTTRHTMFQDYKATRQAPPSDLFDQKDHIVEFANLIGMRQLEKVGVEADDLMFSVAKERAEQGDAVVFVTLDKDMGQTFVLSDQIYMLDTFKDKLYDRKSFEEKMGFSADKMPFYFALLGDASDNIPGVRGIGKKTAVDLVNQFNSLEDIYARMNEIKKARVTNALVQNKDTAFLSRKLFLLQYDSSGLKKDDLKFSAKNWAKARPLFQELNFKSLLKDLGETKEQKERAINEKVAHWQQYNFKTVITTQDLQELCNYLQKKKAFAVDTETNGLRPLQVNLIGLSFCAEKDKAYYVPCGHTSNQQLSCEEIVAALKPILEDPTIKKYLHNTKYDQLVLANHGIELQGFAMDTLVAAKLVIKEWQSPSLKKLSEYYFDEAMLTFADVVKFNKYKDFSHVPLELAVLYSGADALQTFRLVPLLEQELQKLKLEKLYADIEHPLTQVLYAMEREGIYLDTDMLKTLNTKVTKELTTIEEKIAALVGKEAINLHSPRQVEDLLFYKLKLPPQKKTATGAYSTDHEVLLSLAKIHPVPGLIVKHRELSKLKNTYIDALPNYVNPKTNRVHTTFTQTITATGRLSSVNPNLQNIPADASGYGIEIRAAFKPKPDNLFISADYSQIELRVLAYLSQDKNLIDAFLHGHDIHRETAARLFDVAMDQISHDQRQLGKRINFSILYGLTPYGLSKDIGISFKDAKQYIEKYFAQYPGVLAWMESVVVFAKKHGYVQTLWGRLRHVPNIYERNRTLYEEARRVAINTVAQGTAAEIMKQGMIQLNRALHDNNIDAQILLQIHDELLISAPKEAADEVEQLVKQVLESVVGWNVPLIATTRSGADWKAVTK